MTTPAPFLMRLRGIALAGCALAALMRIVAGPHAFRLYGPALAVLLTLPFAHRLLASRLVEHGRSARWALFYSLPAGLLAMLQVGFWLAFFRGSTNLAIQLGVVRQFINDALGGLVPWLMLGVATAAVILVVRLAREPRTARTWG